jgi:hypothetical protein
VRRGASVVEPLWCLESGSRATFLLSYLVRTAFLLFATSQVGLVLYLGKQDHERTNKLQVS